jgi:hypothetical protein
MSFYLEKCFFDLGQMGCPPRGSNPHVHFTITSLACAVGPSVTTSATDFSFQKTWFFGIYLNFQQQKSVLNQHLPHSGSKSYQINSIKSCSSRSFQQHQRHDQIPSKFSATI